VLDWGGSGKPIVLLAAAETRAHVFDEFAPKLRRITMFTALRGEVSARPGFQLASNPADRLVTTCSRSSDTLKLKQNVW